MDNGNGTPDPPDPHTPDPQPPNQWAKPRPLKTIPPLPECPFRVFSPAVEGMLVTQQRFIQVDRAMLVPFVLSALSTACQRFAVVASHPNVKEQLTLHAVVVAESGKRKGPSAKAAWDVIVDFDRQAQAKAAAKVRAMKHDIEVLRKRIDQAINAEAKGAPKASRDEVIDLRRQLEQLQDAAHKPKLLAQDATTAKLGVQLAEQQECCGLLEAEAITTVRNILGRFSGDLVRLLNKGWSGELDIVGRMSRDVRIELPRIAMGLGIQRVVLAMLGKTPEIRELGFHARILWAFPDERYDRQLSSTQKPLDVDAVGRYQKLMIKLLSHEARTGDDIHVIRLSTAARECLNAFNDTEIKGTASDAYHEIDDWMQKMRSQVVRIAALIHCSLYPAAPWDHDVELETMQNACRLGLFFRAHAYHALAIEMGGDDGPVIQRARRIIRYLEAHPHIREFTKRDLFVATKSEALKTADLLDAPLQLMCDRGCLQLVPTATEGKPGRPASPRYLVNPLGLRPEADTDFF